MEPEQHTAAIDHEMRIVITTTATREQARELASRLVQERLVACAQISEIESFYRWDGVLQNDPEWRLWLKTTAGRYAEVEALIRQHHPYDLPAIYAIPVSHASAPYAAWVGHEVKPGAMSTVPATRRQGT